MLGYLIMLDSSRGKWDKEVMLDILKMLLQDTVDFAWENARNFYRMVGLDVEAGIRRWTDTDAIKDRRIIHSRIVYPEKKEVKEGKKGIAGKTTSQNLRCCALYQKRACEQNRDHQPFTHACSYCAKATGVASDTLRKTVLGSQLTSQKTRQRGSNCAPSEKH